ncbi:hypothetical protein Nepgr_007380 [Nepenthes gracilis]|uniref:Uncharacterized protein n=1 Tax=Nepenthes gracilis TaxID=150966 RepID=A0AAD3S6Z5_NEPGR|nr:hypothetical protein Nepgr_007380 [Nepenthes gracilis]
MEDDLVIVHPETLEGFSFAAVFDDLGGLSSVKFLRQYCCAKALSEILYCSYVAVMPCLGVFQDIKL